MSISTCHSLELQIQRFCGRFIKKYDNTHKITLPWLRIMPCVLSRKTGLLRRTDKKKLDEKCGKSTREFFFFFLRGVYCPKVLLTTIMNLKLNNVCRIQKSNQLCKVNTKQEICQPNEIERRMSRREVFQEHSQYNNNNKNKNKNTSSYFSRLANKFLSFICRVDIYIAEQRYTQGIG